VTPNDDGADRGERHAAPAADHRDAQSQEAMVDHDTRPRAACHWRHVGGAERIRGELLKLGILSQHDISAEATASQLLERLTDRMRNAVQVVGRIRARQGRQA